MPRAAGRPAAARALREIDAVIAGCRAELAKLESTRDVLVRRLAKHPGRCDCVTDTAREVTRLFEVRGFQLMDQHPNAPNGELVLEYAKSNRALAATKGDSQMIGSSDVGSVFYVWVTPTDSSTRVAMIGKPTLAGVQPCTKDDIQLPCQTISASPTFVSTYMSGKDEADVVHGVLAELSLEGYVTGAVPAGTPAPVYTIAPTVRNEAHDRCVAQRKQAIANAEDVPDLDKRAELRAEIKDCP